MSDQTTGGSTASSLMASAKDAAGEAYEEARARASDVASRTASAAKAEAMGRAEEAKVGLADQGERLAESLRSALAGGDDSIQAKLMAAAADSVTDLAESLRGRSFDQLLADAGAFARRNPGAFAAAAAVAGFAVARFARASAPAASAYADIEGTGVGSSYGSPRQTGGGYAASGGVSYSGTTSYSGATAGSPSFGAPRGGQGAASVKTRGLSTHDDDFDDSSVEATPDADLDLSRPGSAS